MDWALFITALFDAWMKCREDRERDELEARLQSPRFCEYRAVRRAVRSLGLPWKEREAATEEAWEDLRTMPRPELAELVDEAESRYVASKAPTTPVA